MRADCDILSEMRKGLQKTVLEEVSAARDSSLAPIRPDPGELLLAELRMRRERLRNLLRLINEEARLEEGFTRNSRGRHQCRRSSAGAGSHIHSRC